MSEIIKKLGVSFWLSVASVVLAIVGFITMLMSNATQGYAISNLGLTVAAIIVAALCVVAWVYVCSKNDVHGLASFVLSLAAVLLLTYAFGNIIMNRAELASALFSYDAVNTIGWGVFYKSIVAIACCLISAVIMIVNGFIVKNNK